MRTFNVNVEGRDPCGAAEDFLRPTGVRQRQVVLPKRRGPGTVVLVGRGCQISNRRNYDPSEVTVKIRARVPESQMGNCE